MFADHSWQTIFFRLLNFGVFVAVLWYVAKKYLIVTIKTHIAQRNSLLKNLAQEYAQIQLKQRSLDQYMMEQEKLTQALIGKAHRWKLIVDEYHIRRENEQQQLKAEIERRMAIRSEKMALSALQQQVLPGAIAQARQELTAYFMQKNQGHEFIGELIRKIERENRG
jgi:F0F1-type ATP synthase membrane subunit b/b'